MLGLRMQLDYGLCILLECPNEFHSRHHDLYMHCYALINLSIASCNLFTQHVCYLLWRDTTSELWTPVHSFTSEYTIYCNHCSLHFLQVTIIFHTICLILCFQQAGEIDNLTVTLGQSFLVVLCRWCLKSYWFDNLGFFSEGKLAATLIISFSWGLPTDV